MRSATRRRAIGWYDSRAEMVANVPAGALDLSVYTHVAFDGPSFGADGTVSCTGYGASGVGAVLRNRTRAAGAKMLWIMTDDTAKLLCDNCTRVRQRFIRTARAAMLRCDADGIEFDFEGPGDNAAADDYTEFLVQLKAALGPGLVVSADIAVWTDFPWVNPKHPGYDSLDYLNVMTYFWSAQGSIQAYEAATSTLQQWGFPLASLNLGVPFYTSKQGAWGGISAACPSVAPDVNNCSGALFVGKNMCAKIGEHIQRVGYGGVFPWQANYDTSHDNNSLIPWIAKGMNMSPLPPLPPPPPPNPRVPVYIGKYIFASREAARAACEKLSTGAQKLCKKEELVGHSSCAAGWCEDFEGYWMSEAAKGCGGKGFNDWSGPAGAFCCKEWMR